jgi:hypothetical protein
VVRVQMDIQYLFHRFTRLAVLVADLMARLM